LLAHDVSHVVYGCDTGMYDELKFCRSVVDKQLQVSEITCAAKDPTSSPAIKAAMRHGERAWGSPLYT